MTNINCLTPKKILNGNAVIYKIMLFTLILVVLLKCSSRISASHETKRVQQSNIWYWKNAVIFETRKHKSLLINRTKFFPL